MNVFKTFEQRMDNLFGASSQGYAAPISFKRLAKRTSREMESETYVVDGVNTAPALYTVLVSSNDDAAMHALYPEITTELADCVEAEAARKGYDFVGAPLVRFMVDPSLRSGKFAVFAENVDARTLERLRREEEAFLSDASIIGGAASAVSTASPVEIAHGGHGRGRGHRNVMPAVEPAPAPEPAAAAEPFAYNQEPEQLYYEPAAAPEPYAYEPEPEPIAPQGAHSRGAHAATPVEQPAPTPAPSAAPMSRVPQISSDHRREIPVADPVAIPVTNPNFADDSAGLGVIPADCLDGAYTNLRSASEPEQLPLMSPAAPVPATTRRPSAQPAPVPAPAPAPAPVNPSCQLINHQTGEVHTITDTQAVLGRERAAGAVVLRDPNVSRRHARISFDGRGWRIQDLQSTNGTLVNDVDVNECALRNGDLITVGLVNLEFRER